MSLWRLLWIPGGARAAEGVYARYPAEELLAILALESHRNHALVVDEDLGPVPQVVRPRLDQHGIRRMFILERELDRAGDTGPVDAVPPRVLAGINTHDMPPFASWWRGRDISLRQELGLDSSTTSIPEARANAARGCGRCSRTASAAWARSTIAPSPRACSRPSPSTFAAMHRSWGDWRL